MKRDRAYRRWRRDIARQKLQRMGEWWFSFEERRDNPEWFYCWVMRMVQCKTPCSQPWCCGNPRRSPGKKMLTQQEMRADTTLKEEYPELLKSSRVGSIYPGYYRDGYSRDCV